LERTVERVLVVDDDGMVSRYQPAARVDPAEEEHAARLSVEEIGGFHAFLAARGSARCLDVTTTTSITAGARGPRASRRTRPWIPR
jgi:hypothetical protein